MGDAPIGGPAPAAAHPVVGFGRLLRIALFPSAVADVLVGVALAHFGEPPASPLVWLLIPASLGIYHGAMALNDWADRHQDARERPDRPIPSGAIPAPAALIVALALMGGGVLWAGAVGVRALAWMGAVALLAAGYDLAGRGAARGPLLLGLCRAGNLGAGLLSPWLAGAAAPTWPAPPVVLLLLLYGLHVASISSLGRLEDGEDDAPLGERPTWFLRAAAATAFLLPFTVFAFGELAEPPFDLPGSPPLSVATSLLALGLGVMNMEALMRGLRTLRAGGEGWTRAAVGAATGLCLRRLPWLSASLAASVVLGGAVGAAAFAFCLGGGYVSKALRRTFPLT